MFYINTLTIQKYILQFYMYPSLFLLQIFPIITVFRFIFPIPRPSMISPVTSGSSFIPSRFVELLFGELLIISTDFVYNSLLKLASFMQLGLFKKQTLAVPNSGVSLQFSCALSNKVYFQGSAVCLQIVIKRCTAQKPGSGLRSISSSL